MAILVLALLAGAANALYPVWRQWTLDGALVRALDREDAVAVRQLVALGADARLTARDGTSVLMAACSSGDVILARKLLNSTADLEQRQCFPDGSGSGATALMLAAGRGHVAVVRELLARGAKVNTSSALGDTVLHWAVEGGNARVVRALIAAGADVSDQDDHLQSPLMAAVRGGQEAIVRVLLDQGADVRARDRHGSDAFELARENPEVLRLLTSAAVRRRNPRITGLQQAAQPSPGYPMSSNGWRPRHRPARPD